MRGILGLFVGLLVAGAVAAWWLVAERRTPEASVVGGLQSLGRKTPFEIDVRAPGPGLRGVSVRLRAVARGGEPSSFDIFNEAYPAPGFLQRGVNEKRIRVETDLEPLGVAEGPATLEVLVDTYGWRLLRRTTTPVLSIPVAVDLTPPQIALLSPECNVRLGGSEVAVFRKSADTVGSGVEVGKYSFPSIDGYFADPAIAVVFFAVPQDLSADARVRLLARDAAGNERDMTLPCKIRAREFPSRTLAIDDDFLARKVPELERENGLPPQADAVAGYLAINRDLRRRNEAKIKEITAQSAREPLWDGAFHRQSGAAPLSAFADRRTYTHAGQPIDHQTHLGYDLASLKLSPVEAAHNGVVAFADNLGIYGRTVILDHGMGIFSLYGHLSSIAVKRGDRVKREQALGQTGETGLAGGDHLHYSTMLNGIHVDPVEWWDAHWLRDHVTRRLTLFPRAGQATAGDVEAGPAATPPSTPAAKVP